MASHDISLDHPLPRFVGWTIIGLDRFCPCVHYSKKTVTWQSSVQSLSIDSLMPECVWRLIQKNADDSPNRSNGKLAQNQTEKERPGPAIGAEAPCFRMINFNNQPIRKTDQTKFIVQLPDSTHPTGWKSHPTNLRCITIKNMVKSPPAPMAIILE